MKNLDFSKILNGFNKKNIVIIGHMSSGKTVIGKIIAKKFGFLHLDSDREMVRLEKKTINHIFKDSGEKYFREIEKNVNLRIIKKNDIVISLGGGAIMNNLVRKELKKNSLTLFLDVGLVEIVKRLEKSYHRPLLKNVNIKEKIKELDIERRKYYLNADIVIKNATTPHETYKNFYLKFLELNEKNNN